MEISGWNSCSVRTIDTIFSTGFMETGAWFPNAINCTLTLSGRSVIHNHHSEADSIVAYRKHFTTNISTFIWGNFGVKSN